MPTLELTIEQLRDVQEALEFREMQYRFQARATGCTKEGLEWIERYARNIKKITDKIKDEMRLEVIITHNSTSNRYDWSYGGQSYPEWRMGLKSLEETKSWLKNEKLMNPYLVFREV